MRTAPTIGAKIRAVLADVELDFRLWLLGNSILCKLAGADR